MLWIIKTIADPLSPNITIQTHLLNSPQWETKFLIQALKIDIKIQLLRNSHPIWFQGALVVTIQILTRW